MTIATLSWPAAAVYVALIAAIRLAVSVLIWSIFRTGQTAIRSENRRRMGSDNRRMSADET
jgi:hypothetical protein